MNTSRTHTPVAVLLAHDLERMERSHPDAAQYRLVAQRLAAELDQAPDLDLLQPLLKASPAAAAIYENLRYQHAGLCRSPLEAALAAEQRARALIAGVQARARSGGAPSGERAEGPPAA
ncbi:hypothetical protein [uncultured Pseudacidovorax sp.]|uniref:hypothetical protein n=1 Tax=uncultured Pseudacidovorax sp. TaxID=679313 RepID=UPI0025CCD1ED|nr:hypothetical protein [uncultured Pseudacidovorax sp.]